MQEIELKFQIPADGPGAASPLEALTALLRALPGGDRPPQRLQAAYFDTADRRLARARAALRVRQEDDDWVQTLKAAGPNAMTRLEDNQPLPGFAPGEAIRPDLARHTDAAVREALARDLGWRPDADPRGAQAGLLPLYRTDMRRLRALADTSAPAWAGIGPDASVDALAGMAGRAPPERRTSHAGQVEIALDLGEIAAGPLRRPVRELEIELTGGDARAVLDVARALVRRHGLWLDTQTKAHRGDQLAREAESGRPSPLPPARPRARVKPGMTPDAAWLAAVDAALDQIGACLSEVALHRSAGSPAGSALETLDVSPWIRGWGVGLRRMAWLWRHAPASIAAHTSLRPNAFARHLLALRNGPGRWLGGDAASAFARSAAPTLLALDVLEVIVAAQGGRA